MKLARIGLTALIVLNTASGQSARLSLSIDDPRPVAAAARALMDRHDLVVTYEDPGYAHAGDLADVTAQVRTDGNSTARVLVPVGGRMDFEYSVSTELDPSAAMSAVLRDMLDYHELGGGAGRFRISESGEFIHVIPEQVRDSSGSWTAYAPVLDTRVTLPGEQNNSLLLIQQLVEAVSNATGTTMVTGTVPINLLLKSSGSADADNAVARDVLASVLSKVDAVQLTWMLFYDPGQRLYALNIVPVRERELPMHVPDQPSPSDTVDPITGRSTSSPQ